jgi:Flp pilus assembly protein TadD
MLAGLLVRTDQPEAGRSYLERALRLRPDDYATLYNAACFYCLVNEQERALDLLERACAQGSGNREWIEHDSDLAVLHGHPRFVALLARLDEEAKTAPA